MDKMTLEERLAKSDIQSSFSHHSVIFQLKIIADMLADGRLCLANDGPTRGILSSKRIVPCGVLIFFVPHQSLNY